MTQSSSIFQFFKVAGVNQPLPEYRYLRMYRTAYVFQTVATTFRTISVALLVVAALVAVFTESMIRMGLMPNHAPLSNAVKIGLGAIIISNVIHSILSLLYTSGVERVGFLKDPSYEQMKEVAGSITKLGIRYDVTSLKPLYSFKFSSLSAERHLMLIKIERVSYTLLRIVYLASFWFARNDMYAIAALILGGFFAGNWSSVEPDTHERGFFYIRLRWLALAGWLLLLAVVNHVITASILYETGNLSQWTEFWLDSSRYYLVIGLSVVCGIGLVLYVCSLIIDAASQMLEATTDIAVNSSPFISDDFKSSIMSSEPNLPSSDSLETSPNLIDTKNIAQTASA